MNTYLVTQNDTPFIIRAVDKSQALRSFLAQEGIEWKDSWTYGSDGDASYLTLKMPRTTNPKEHDEIVVRDATRELLHETVERLQAQLAEKIRNAPSDVQDKIWDRLNNDGVVRALCAALRAEHDRRRLDRQREMSEVVGRVARKEVNHA